ncbi:Phosphatidylinositol 4-phosphate 3-kinase C2 domain-containing subunit alpha [Orchesella cincta]|uniref:Phosphatidylinositol 4-phosphate 3-kinase C2 domain-containing subunit alpha n=1 Tax=Orchesella cincta TaxID=48709 RepID=A0A1D2MLB9_ORCCI|nr:Phosphatidylinositol 4-phosphate 3-kinase C2 domain-containing subunit alpha [Orchesella cincta]
MGDNSSARNTTSADDPQYEADLELATRLSLETFESEKRRRNVNDTLSIPSQVKGWSRANSCNTHGEMSANDGQNANSAFSTAIIPPPPNSSIKRHRSLPYRVHGRSQDSSSDITSPKGDASPNGITNEPTPKALLSVTDDLISLASPQATPKFAKRDTVSNCDSLFATFGSNGSAHYPSVGVSPVGNPANTSVFPTNSRGSTTPQSGSIYPSIPNTLPLNPPPPLGFKINPNGFSSPPTTIVSPPSNFNGNKILSPADRNSINPAWNNVLTQRNSIQPTITSTDILNSNRNYTGNGNPIKKFPMGDDLIDLGQYDSKKILEFFDPLLSPGSPEHSLKKARDKGIVSAPNGKLGGGGGSSSGSSPNAPTVPDRTSLPLLPSETRNMDAKAESAPQRHSLYPSLSGTVDESSGDDISLRSESPFSALRKQLAECDESSIYDAYNPLEYLFAVSCSSASSTVASEFYYATTVEPSNKSDSGSVGERRSIGFSHYYPDSVASIDPVPPALPPRNNEQADKVPEMEPAVQRRRRVATSDRAKRASAKLYENIESVKQYAPFDSEVQAFYDMLRDIRLSCRHVDSNSNRGYMYSPTFPTNTMREGFSTKFKVWNESFTKDPVVFVCDVSTLVEHVLEQSLMDLGIQGSGRDFILRVYGLNEYLCPGVPVSDFRYVQQCIKLDEDVRLVLVQRSSLERKTWSRTPRDDAQCVEMDIDTILPGQPPKAITYSDISRFLEVIDRESEKLRDKLNFNRQSGSSLHKDPTSFTLNPTPFIQPVKGVCVLLGDIQTVDVKNSLDLFTKACDEWNSKLKVSSPIDPSPEPRRRLRVCSDVSSRYSVVDLEPSSFRDSGCYDEPAKDFVISALEQVEESVRILVEMYSKSFPVSFRMKKDLNTATFRRRQGGKSTADLSDTFLLRIGAVHRLSPDWLSTYIDYFLVVEVYHGSTPLVKNSTGYITPSKTDNNLFFTSLIYDCWVNFEQLPLCILPRECRLVFTLCGRKPQDEKNDALDIIELGWSSIQCFNFKGQLVQGNYILPFWPKGLIQKRLGPAPNPMTSSDSNATLISIEFTDNDEEIHFPEIPSAVPFFRDFVSLDDNTQQMLKHIIENCTFTKFPAEDREILWEKRHYLYQYPNALPKVLLSARLWDYASLAEIHAMLRHWAPMDPIDALQLLLPCFPDGKVREQAITWIAQMDNEELVNMLPQLIEALSYETFDFSPLAEFLLRKSLSCLKIAHTMFWLLASQVGLGKWLSEFEGVSIVSSVPQAREEIIFDPKRRRLELMLNSLMISSGTQWKSALVAEYKMIQIFSDIATQVKNAPSSSRNEVLIQELHKIDVLGLNGSKSFPLPLSPAYDIRSIDVQSCYSFSSASVPLKINFINGLPEGGTIPVLYKKGDDLRQDLLTIQIIRVIEKWWLKEGLDFRVLTFSCVPTGYQQGVVEMVPNSETLCKIQAEYGVTGAFQDRPISDWLAKMNPNTVDYKRAVENFTVTCAAYCVLTYVLGICDRHNDNIMLTTSGHLFHIDFGKFLGDAQRFGTFKRDRTPFVLTSDMVYVINDGEKSSHKFHRFVELCCQAFRIVRHNGNVLVNLFALMATAGIPGVDLKSVNYIQTALLPDCSNAEAAARFTRFIEDSLRNWFTPVNFFIHSLGQFKFLSEAPDNPCTLSFVQKTYSIEEDGRIVKAVIRGYKKKYDPEKYYSYILEVKRDGVGDSFILNRSYKEFLELYSKLCVNFPMIVSNLKHLPKGPGLGRSNVKQVAEKRKIQLQMFLDSLFLLAPEVSHSTLVYTFFHPLLRDEEQYEDGDTVISPTEGIRMTPARIHGKIKISLEYVRSALCVLILHAVDLACPNGQPPSPYVKTYLIPDISRITKRKTRVVRRSQFPTFMEMIEYRLPLEIIRQKTLQVSVWHYDPLQENNFLGGVAVPLTTLTADKEVLGTYPLGNINFV